MEQKNYTHVRCLLGYERLSHQELLSELNELLSLWSLWKNLFSVTMKQESCHRVGTKQERRHSKISQTRSQRLIDSGSLTSTEKKYLKAQISSNNPFTMKAEIAARSDVFWRKRNELLEQEKGERLASEGYSERSVEQPSEALNQPQTQHA